MVELFEWWRDRRDGTGDALGSGPTTLLRLAAPLAGWCALRHIGHAPLQRTIEGPVPDLYDPGFALN